MKEKKPFYKKWWFWVLVVFFFLVMGNLNTGSKKTSSTPDPEPEPVETVKDAEPEVKEVPVLSYFAEATGIKEASIKEQDGYIEIVYTMEGTPYDYTAYVSKGLTDFVKTGKFIFGNTDCKSLRMDMQLDDKTVTSLIISKEDFESVDWSAIAYTEGIYDKIQEKFQKFYVESMLMKGVETDKIMYKGK